MPPSPPQQQQQRRAGVRTRCTLCYVLLLFAGVTIFVAGVAWLVAWARLNQGPDVPRFTVASLSISGGQVAFNVSDSNPNRHVGIHYKGPTRASLFLYYDSLVASGPAFAATGWYQPGMNTTSIAGVLDVLGPWTANHTLSFLLRAGRLPLSLRLSTAPISFSRNVFLFPSVEKSMHVNCDLLVGRDGRLLREYVEEPCDSYFGLLHDNDD